MGRIQATKMKFLRTPELQNYNVDFRLSLFIIFRFHCKASEPILGHTVVPPVRDDVQLSVDEYRSKLYELMATGTGAHTRHCKVNHEDRYWKIWHLVMVDSFSNAIIMRGRFIRLLVVKMKIQ